MTKKQNENSEQKTNAERIWEEIRGVKVDMFSLPDQTVEKYCSPKMVEPTKLYLTFTVQSVVPALEAALGKKFLVEVGAKYLIVSYRQD